MSRKNADEASLRSKVQQRRRELNDAKATPSVGVSTWIVGGLLTAAVASLVVASWVANGSIYSGVTGAGMLLWLAFGVTAIYALALGRPTWLRLKNGRRSAIWAALWSATGFVLSGTVMAALAV